MRSVPSSSLVGPFADRLLALDLPGLHPARRREAIDFTTRRVDSLPSLMRFGVMSIAAIFRALLVLPRSDTLVKFLARTALPLLGEYVRLLRSLGYAYIWETWPDTRPDGSQPDDAEPGGTQPGGRAA
ncbi:MAG: hypothetical protein FD127_3431 [Acidimicrobiaceae bacterium]|jgi:hypothetical protein|nr:MAG: hypothetical protein FD127_3431 [Acidimicrobiaceae bacterium]